MSLPPVLILLVITPYCFGQITCPAINFSGAQTINLKPTPSSHLELLRQSDSSWTAFEVPDANTSLVLSATPHFEKQIFSCVPADFFHTAPPPPSPPPLASTTGRPLPATIGPGKYLETVRYNNGFQIDVLDSQHNLLSTRTFNPAPPPDVLGSENFADPLLADVDGDGKLDLVAFSQFSSISNKIENAVWILPGKGDGSFGDGVRLILPWTGAVHAIVADMNGDGNADLIAADTSSQILTIGYGIAGNQFTFRTYDFPVNFQESTGAFVAADLNGDGRMDLVLAGAQPDYTPTVAVMLAKAEGGFSAPRLYAPIPSSGLSFEPGVPAVGDLNGDSIPDIVLSTGTILFGDGKGGFPKIDTYALGFSTSVAITDVNGDGVPDLVFGGGTADALFGSQYVTSTTIMPGTGAGTFFGPLAGDFGLSSPQFAVADFDGDGMSEVALLDSVSGSTRWSTLKLATGRRFAMLKQGLVPNPVEPGAAFIVAADFDGDRKQDLMLVLNASSAGSQLQFYRGTGDGGFEASLSTVITEKPDFLIAADINGDSIPDLAGSGGGQVWVRLGKGDGTFGPVTYITNVESPSIAVADFNQDGKPDLVITDSNASSMTMLPGKGDGSFGAAVKTVISGFLEPIGKQLPVADLNGDGFPDTLIQVYSSSVSGLIPLLGSPDGTFHQGNVITQGGPSFGFVAAADLNGDRVPDLILNIPYRGSSRPYNFLAGNNDGTFGALLPGPAGAAALLYSNLNGDGLPDLVEITYSGFVAPLLNISRTPPPLTVVSAASFSPGPVSADSFVACFGQRLTSEPLMNVEVSVQDSAGTIRPAPVVFASLEQVNFLIPAATAAGQAVVSVADGSLNAPLTAEITIAPLAPALFTQTAYSYGQVSVVAGYAIHVDPDGNQTVQPLTSPSPDQSPGTPVQLEALAVDVTSPGAVYLALFGTGFDVASIESTTAAIQGLSVPVTYAGPVPGYSGLDQINLLLRPSLAGMGTAFVAITIGGIRANLATFLVH